MVGVGWILSHVIHPPLEKKVQQLAVELLPALQKEQRQRKKMVGKKKRDTSVASRKLSPGVYDQTPPGSDASHDVFRRYFEARFLPLDIPTRVTDRSVETVKRNEDDETADLQSDSEWSGFSDGDEDNKVEVVEYRDSCITSDDAMDKKARKAFMVCLHIEAT